MPRRCWNQLEDDNSNEGSDGDETAPNVLAQFIVVALFGETPKIVADFMTEIMDSAKDTVSHLYSNEQRINIEDAVLLPQRGTASGAKCEGKVGRSISCRRRGRECEDGTDTVFLEE